MTVPVQRGPDTNGQGMHVLGFVAESLRRLEDSVARGFADVNVQLSKLPNEYIPRQELQRELDRLTLNLGVEEVERRADIAALRAQLEEDARRAAEQARAIAAERTNARRWLIGLAVTGALSAAGVVSGIVLHFT